jgi:hypothetical protein
VFRRILDNDVPQNGDQVARLELKIYKWHLISESHAAKQSKSWSKLFMYEILHSALFAQCGSIVHMPQRKPHGSMDVVITAVFHKHDEYQRKYFSST